MLQSPCRNPSYVIVVYACVLVTYYVYVPSQIIRTCFKPKYSILSKGRSVLRICSDYIFFYLVGFITFHLIDSLFSYHPANLSNCFRIQAVSSNKFHYSKHNHQQSDVSPRRVISLSLSFQTQHLDLEMDKKRKKD